MQSNQTCTDNKPSDNQRLKKDEGFTLIEVLLAVSIFAIGLLGVAAMQISAIQVNSVANHLTARATRAQDQLERLRALPYNHADLADGTHPGTTADGYTVTWNVTDENPVPNTKTITLTVTKNAKTTRFVTIKAQM